MQAANGGFSKLKSFPESNSFDPKHFAAGCGSDDGLVALISWYLVIDKEILQFDGMSHANGLKSVSRPPMP